MTICPNTDTKWDNLPHVILTADTDWDPSVIDHKLEDGEEWFDAMQDLPDIEPDPLFDDVKDYKCLHYVTNAMIDSNFIKTEIIDYQDFLLLHNQNVMPSKLDHSQYQSNKPGYLSTSLNRHL